MKNTVSNKISKGFISTVTRHARIGMVKNTDGSYTFNGRKCLLVDNGGRISVVWL